VDRDVAVPARQILQVVEHINTKGRKVTPGQLHEVIMSPVEKNFKLVQGSCTLNVELITGGFIGMSSAVCALLLVPRAAIQPVMQDAHRLTVLLLLDDYLRFESAQRTRRYVTVSVTPKGCEVIRRHSVAAPAPRPAFVYTRTFLRGVDKRHAPLAEDSDLEEGNNLRPAGSGRRSKAGGGNDKATSRTRRRPTDIPASFVSPSRQHRDEQEISETDEDEDRILSSHADADARMGDVDNDIGVDTSVTLRGKAHSRSHRLPTAIPAPFAQSSRRLCDEGFKHEDCVEELHGALIALRAALAPAQEVSEMDDEDSIFPGSSGADTDASMGEAVSDIEEDAPGSPVAHVGADGDGGNQMQVDEPHDELLPDSGYGSGSQSWHSPTDCRIAWQLAVQDFAEVRVVAARG
jgi:hypothetical protein